MQKRLIIDSGAGATDVVDENSDDTYFFVFGVVA